MDQNEQKPVEGASLEGDSSSAPSTPSTPDGKPPVSPTAQKPSFIKRILGKLNVYLLLFILVLFLAAVIAFIAMASNKSNKTNTVKTQSLTDSTLKQLANSDVTVGQPTQILNVQSNAVFAGKVLIRDSLEVAGTIQVGGALNIPGITVSGDSTFESVNIQKTLQVTGDTGVQGQLSVLKGLSVAGGATFGSSVSAPQLAVNNLQLNGDLNLVHHIAAGGPSPSHSTGSAVGSGGSASASGSDTAGTININTGGSPSAGCFISLNFAQKYNATPHVLATPIDSAAGTVGYYVTRTVSGFSVCAANTPPSNASFGFDYFVVD